MAFATTTFRVAIASPGDVREERLILREAIHNWNAAHSLSRRIALLPVGWEHNAAPLMGARAQEIINTQVIDSADLLVAVFWTRLGSPTGVAPSGTVEEIREFLSAGKPVMIYFSSAPVKLESVDASQYQALLEFRRWCESNGLIAQYDSVVELRERFARDLALVVNTHPTFAVQAELSDRLEATAVLGPAPQVVLSSAALALLQKTAQDPNGTLIVAETLSGLVVETNSESLAPEGDPKTGAMLRAIVDELKNHGLIEDVGTKGELFRVTHLGYYTSAKS